MSRTLFLRKTTPNPKSNKPFLEFCIMCLSKCLCMWMTWHNFPILSIIKDPNSKNILRLPLDFHIELSRLLDLDRWQYPYIISNEYIVIYLQDLRALPRFLVPSCTHKAICYENVWLLYLMNETYCNK